MSIRLKNNYENLMKEAIPTRRYCESCKTRKQNGLYLSVADSDFCFPKGIMNDLVKFIKKRSLNYTYRTDDFSKAIKIWYEKEYDVKFTNYTSDNLVIGNGVINFIQIAIEAFSLIGDGVIFLSPVYYSFLTSVERSFRKPVKSKLSFDEKSNKFVINFKDLESKMKKKENKIIILCNPHNPIGRNWTKEELSKIIDLARKYKVFIISDEIWQDITFDDRKCNPIISLTNEYDKAVSISSFGKTFNLGGAQFGFAVSQNKNIASILNTEKNKHLAYASDNLINIEMAESCIYNEDNYEWLQAYKKIIKRNYEWLKKAIKNTKIIMPDMEATYLCWLDFSKYKMTKAELDDIWEKNCVYLEDGSDFCEEYDLCKRVNISISEKNIKLFIKILKNNFK